MAVNNPPNSEFQFTEDFDVTEDVKHAFDINGYVLVRGLLSREELSLLTTALEKDDGIMAKRYARSDGEGEGRKAKVCLWNQPGEDITGVIARSEKVAGTFEKLLGGEVYHYHSKVIMKEARTGGAHIWHQDYGYWYENGCIFPNMGTTWIAVDKADRTNGCLKGWMMHQYSVSELLAGAALLHHDDPSGVHQPRRILEGSHRVGRVTHVKTGDQAGADVERVKEVEKFCPLRHVEVEPGDCLFFHCNVLHRSDKNDSDRRRWAFLVSFNRADNNPVYVHHHPQYSPLIKVPNSEIVKCSPDLTLEGKDFFKGPETDVSLRRIEERLGSK